MERRGAGEILLTSMDRDGTKAGFNIPLTRAIADAAEAADALAKGAEEIDMVVNLRLVKEGDVDAVEAHGTGTILGDPIEASALGRVLGAGRGVETPILLGSAKTNIGHSESAAGVVGLIKVIQAMRNDVIPANINYTAPNRYIDFMAERLEVVEDPREGPEYSGKKVAGVSGFGFGGTNASLVLGAVRG